MPAATSVAIGELGNWLGREVACSDWFELSQERIDAFAEATEDRQWIHVDRERARQSPYGTTIAHGFLTLSLLSRLLREALEVQGLRMALNYGLNRVRFPAPVPAGSKIRARFKLDSLKDIPGGVEAVFAAAIERQDAEKPVCVAEWVVRYYT
ncbi:MAG TPA: MaoC family dehydratase [Terriglobales bacterium]|jgi:acyl dehydratase|nr:MaoC family dehydratase [Terriglobales bacterium]